MDTLQRLLTRRVLETLRGRAHVAVSPSRSEALHDEIEVVIADTLAALGPQLDVDGTGALTERTLGALVERVTLRLMESDHVDDIYADDRVMRRDAYRTARETLLGYVRGELDVAEIAGGECFNVTLDALGYVVSAIAGQLDHDMLRDALERSAASVDARLQNYDPSRHVASFCLPGGAAAGRLPVEEAISEELQRLVEAELVELPSIEQVLELPDGGADAPGFAAALARAELATQHNVDCAAQCAVIDDSTLVATLTPLTRAAADDLEGCLTTFLSALEEALAEVAAVDADDAPPTKKPSSRDRRRDAPSSQRHASQRHGRSKQGKQSSSKGGAGRASRTRHRGDMPKKRRAK